MFIPFRDGERAEYIVIPTIALIVLNSMRCGYLEVTIITTTRLTNLRLIDLRLIDLRLIDLRLTDLPTYRLTTYRLTTYRLTTYDLRLTDLRLTDLRLTDLRLIDLRLTTFRLTTYYPPTAPYTAIYTTSHTNHSEPATRHASQTHAFLLNGARGFYLHVGWWIIGGL